METTATAPAKEQNQETEYKLRTKNQLYKLSNAGTYDVPYAKWIENEKLIHFTKMNKGKIDDPDLYEFNTWLNDRYNYLEKNGKLMPPFTERQMNASGQIGKLINEGEKLTQTVKDKTADKDEAKENEALKAPVEKRILGLKPIVAYSIGALILVGTAATIILIFKGKNKNK